MGRSVKIYLGIAAVLLLLIVGFIVFRRRADTNKNTARTVIVERADIVQDISFSGNIKAVNAADLSFEIPGTITNLFVDSGDKVTKGQKLAQIDVRSAQLQLAQARASRASAQDQALLNAQKADQDYADAKKLNEKTVTKYRLAVADAKAAFEQAKDAYNATKDESGADSSTAKTKYSTVLTTETAYHNAQKVYSEQKDALNTDTYDMRKAAEIAHAQYSAAVQASLNTPGLSALQAGENLAALSLAKSALLAPFDGVITARNINVGELASATKPVFSLQGDGTLEVTADVPETDATKIAVGQQATVTFDAFSTAEKYDAEVKRVAPAAKIISGVPTFEVRLSINNLNEKIRAGLTANVVVRAAKRTNVLGIQRRAIITRNEKQYVNIRDADGKTEEKEVTTGLLGSNGTIEIISGLNAGDRAAVSAAQ